MTVIPLSRGYVAVVDDCDEGLAAHKWYASVRRHNVYACRKAGGRVLYLHREVLCAAPGVHVDHRDGDGLNCRRANLRAASRFENEQNRGKNRNNRSGFKGVSRSASVRGWVAKISAHGRQRHLGVFRTAEDAARAYDAAASALHGEFAFQNFREAT